MARERFNARTSAHLPSSEICLINQIAVDASDVEEEVAPPFGGFN